MNDTVIQTATRAGREYVITREADSGLHAVHVTDLDGVTSRVGRSQTLAGATLLRRNHARDIQRRLADDDYVPAGDRADMTHPY